MNNPLIVVLMGKSGSGKGTQADLLVEKFGFDYIGSGDLLRKRAQKGDFTGKKLKKVMNSGGLAPIPIIFKLWTEKIESLRNKKNLKGIVMDGNPRKIIEAYLIDDVLEWYGWKNVKAVLIDISNKEAIWRLTKRRICQKCKKVFPFVGEFRKIKKCPQCGGKLVTRSDDTVSSVKNRLAWFKKEVQPIVNYYKKKGYLIKIDGEQTIERVFEDILEKLT